MPSFEVPPRGTSDLHYEFYPEREITIENVRASIERALPNFDLKEVRVFARGEGVSSAVFLVNDKYLFRGARDSKGDRTYAKEIAILPRLRKTLSCSIPNYEYFGKQADTGFGFVLYKPIVGEGLTREDLQKPDGSIDDELVKSIAEFLRDVHAFDTREVTDNGVPVIDNKKRYTEQLEDARKIVFPFLEAHYPEEANRLKEFVEKIFADYFADARNFVYAPALVHGDLEAHHIRFDRKTRKITGVIDWGGLAINDPDYDLWRPYSHFGKAFIDDLLNHYQHPNPSLLYQKIEFYWSAQVVYRLLRAIVQGWSENIPYQLTCLRERAKSRD